jgi:hypothetical protein
MFMIRLSLFQQGHRSLRPSMEKISESVQGSQRLVAKIAALAAYGGIGGNVLHTGLANESNLSIQ